LVLDFILPILYLEKEFLIELKNYIGIFFFQKKILIKEVLVIMGGLSIVTALIYPIVY
jgi:hypothetical protein